jgi:hypothetical protein
LYQAALLGTNKSPDTVNSSFSYRDYYVTYTVKKGTKNTVFCFSEEQKMTPPCALDESVRREFRRQRLPQTPNLNQIGIEGYFLEVSIPFKRLQYKDEVRKMLYCCCLSVLLFLGSTLASCIIYFRIR